MNSNDNESRTQLFVEDAQEQLSSIERNLLVLERADESDLNIVNEIFRGVHTIKGGADFLGLASVKLLSHAAEDILDLVRNGTLELSKEGISLLLVVTDTLRDLLTIQDGGIAPDLTHLLSEIESLRGDPVNEAPSSEEEIGERGHVVESVGELVELFDIQESNVEGELAAGFNRYLIEYPVNESTEVDQENLSEAGKRLEEIGYLLGLIGPLDARIRQAEEAGPVRFALLKTVLSKTLTTRYLGIEPDRVTQLRSDVEKNSFAIEVDVNSTEQAERTPIEPRDVIRLSEKRTEQKEIAVVREGEWMESSEVASGKIEEFKGQGTIRVNVDLLDNLMNLAGELVLTRNQLNQNVATTDISAINIAAQRLDTVTSELQESIMSTRMQPISIVLNKFQRVSRDMAHQLGKSVRLSVEGEEVELDKSIIEHIGDPLTHLVRNAIDHGIESKEARRAAGKPEEGVLSIKARHEAGHVVIEVSDDGKGIDPFALRDHALEKGFIDRARADEMTERELLRLIFQPGFSTAEKLSDISGRGVGMDVVFTNLSRLGGTIDVDSTVGSGSEFRIKLPLTLAIIPSLLVSAREEVFALPQVNLIELVKLDAGDRIEYIGDSPVYRLRGSLLPIVWLQEFLEFAGEKSSEKSNATNIVVVAAGEFHYGIVVDNLMDSEEIVVKPLGTHLRGCKGYAGATILGDGRAALILDIAGIADCISVQSYIEGDTDASDLLQNIQQHVGSEEKLLVVENGPDEYFGVQLAYVNRIERISTASIEQVGNKTAVKYRGGILRVFSIEDAIEAAERRESDMCYLVIFHMLGIEVAIVISNIIDIVDSEPDLDRSTFNTPGIVGSAVLFDHITLYIDPFALVKAVDPAMGAATGGSNDESREKKTILVVEDSMFFQDKLRGLIEEMNLEVVIAGDGQEGLEELQARGDSIDLILMDVEMPRMTGLELTERIRSESKYKHLPIIMLTSLAKEADVERGKAAGATEYLVKMDQEMVKQTVSRHLGTSFAEKVA